MDFQTADVPKQLRILVVDDEDIDRMALRRMLEKSGLNVTLREAECAAEAFDIISKEQFDCVLLDYHLPDLDGGGIFEFIETKQQEKAPAVVFVSGENNEGLARELLENGAVDFIDKDDLTAAGLKRAVLFAMARRSRQRQLREISEFDGLTSLPGRRLCTEMLDDAIANSLTTMRPGLFVIFEIDRFKGITEKFGPTVAENLLRAVTARLRSSVRGTDKVARFASDQFAVIGCDLLAPDGPEVFVSKIAKALSLPYDMGSTGLFVQFNCGAAMFPDNGRSAPEVVKSAEIALVSAAHSEYGKVAFYDAQLGKNQDRRRELQGDLEQALLRDQMALEYQPVLDVRSGELVSIEALLRWRHHVYGNVPPREFLPAAEASGQIGSIGEWVIQQAAQAASSWNKSLKRPMLYTINAGFLQLQAGGFSEALGNAIRRHNLAPSAIGVEFGEDVLQRKDHHVENELRTLDGLGVRLVLDSFGSARSSVVDLVRLPLHMIKISMGLVLDLEVEPSAAGYVRPPTSEDRRVTTHAPVAERTVQVIVAMASKLGIKTVAVGVESEEQLRIVGKCGVDSVQGYLLGRPCAKEAFADWHRKLPALRKRLYADG
jgi:diguanylate cyclase (GGDEF)-like protein